MYRSHRTGNRGERSQYGKRDHPDKYPKKREPPCEQQHEIEEAAQSQDAAITPSFVRYYHDRDLEKLTKHLESIDQDTDTIGLQDFGKRFEQDRHTGERYTRAVFRRKKLWATCGKRRLEAIGRRMQQRDREAALRMLPRWRRIHDVS